MCAVKVRRMQRIRTKRRTATVRFLIHPAEHLIQMPLTGLTTIHELTYKPTNL